MWDYRVDIFYKNPYVTVRAKLSLTYIVIIFVITIESARFVTEDRTSTGSRCYQPRDPTSSTA